MSVQLATSQTAEDKAWSDFDRATLKMQTMYANPSAYPERARRDQAMLTVRCWQRWRDLYLGKTI